MGGGTGGYRGYMYPPPFLEGGYKRVHSVKVCVYPNMVMIAQGVGVGEEPTKM